ncbi:MAG: DUF86 domain-containing protein [Roseburia sp.]|nr:DUF86 domain-containing protein [Anaeroplasma bactoclasticum]MCM1196035.1 DUF86 domain-containing protein [Roseburia sp.]MCM1557072.1 DUF86 domain-containing protein [Anaeroplasma bactoclasticum]
MKEIKNDEYYLNKMLIYIEYIMQYMDNIRKDNSVLKPNDQASDGVIYKFIQLREESANLSEEVLNNHKTLQKNVKLLNGFRNRLTHDYDNVSYTFFDEIIESDLPRLKKEILKAIKKMINIYTYKIKCTLEYCSLLD